METSDPRLRLLALMVLLTITSACRIKLTLDGSRPGPGGPGPVAGSPSREERVAAVLSIYSHARQAVDGPDKRESAFVPLPVIEAARILRASDTPIGESRRRRAVAKLAAADIHRPEFRDAIEILLQREDGDNPFGNTQLMLLTLDIVISLHVDLSIFDLEAVISNLLELLFGHVHGLYMQRNLTTVRLCAPQTLNLVPCINPFAPCDPCDPTYVHHPNDPCDPCNRMSLLAPFPTTATTTVEIARPVGEIAPGFDGQNWDECSDFFDSTYAAQAAFGLTPPAPLTNPPAPGTTWQGALYESFEMAWLGFSAIKFTNLLDVDSVRTTTPSTYRFDYDLNRWLSSSAGGLPILEAIQKDCGYLSASESGTWTRIENKKTITFTNPGLNQPTCDLFSAMGDSVVELASCSPPPP